MSRKQAMHLDLIGSIREYEKNRKLTFDELADMNETALKKFLNKNKDKSYPSHESIQRYKLNRLSE